MKKEKTKMIMKTKMRLEIRMKTISFVEVGINKDVSCLLKHLTPITNVTISIFF